MGIFPDAQGQITPQSEVEPSRNSNSSEILWLPLFFPKNEEDPIKNEVARVPQHFPHYNSMGAVAMETRVLIPPGPKPNATFPPPQ